MDVPALLAEQVDEVSNRTCAVAEQRGDVCLPEARLHLPSHGFRLHRFQLGDNLLGGCAITTMRGDGAKYAGVHHILRVILLERAEHGLRLIPPTALE